MPGANASCPSGASTPSMAAQRRPDRPGRAQGILTGMTHRVGQKGQVVIPKHLRDQLGIEPGDEVSFWLEDGHVAVRPSRGRPALKGRFAGAGLTEVLIAERRSDQRREDRS